MLNFTYMTNGIYQSIKYAYFLHIFIKQSVVFLNEHIYYWLNHNLFVGIFLIILGLYLNSRIDVTKKRNEFYTFIKSSEKISYRKHFNKTFNVKYGKSDESDPSIPIQIDPLFHTAQNASFFQLSV